MKTKRFRFGEDVAGYSQPVLNEREIRAAAGIMFLLLFSAWMLVVLREDFLLVKYAILIFLTDFLIRVMVSPRYAPLLIIGRLVVSHQTPEYVTAQPKKFAWTIGLALSLVMFLLLVVLNSYSLFTGISCLFCLVFLFFESAFGICLGCWMHHVLYRQHPLYCPGQVCEERVKQPVQKTSDLQVLILCGLAAALLLAVFFLNDYLMAAPKHLGN